MNMRRRVTQIEEAMKCVPLAKEGYVLDIQQDHGGAYRKLAVVDAHGLTVQTVYHAASWACLEAYCLALVTPYQGYSWVMELFEHNGRLPD